MSSCVNVFILCVPFRKLFYLNVFIQKRQQTHLALGRFPNLKLIKYYGLVTLHTRTYHTYILHVYVCSNQFIAVSGWVREMLWQRVKKLLYMAFSVHLLDWHSPDGGNTAMRSSYHTFTRLLRFDEHFLFLLFLPIFNGISKQNAYANNYHVIFNIHTHIHKCNYVLHCENNVNDALCIFLILVLLNIDFLWYCCFRFYIWFVNKNMKEFMNI